MITWLSSEEAVYWILGVNVALIAMCLYVVLRLEVAFYRARRWERNRQRSVGEPFEINRMIRVKTKRVEERTLPYVPVVEEPPPPLIPRTYFRSDLDRQVKTKEARFNNKDITSVNEAYQRVKYQDDEDNPEKS